MMLQGGCDADGGIVTQALLQRTALQPVHRHDYVQLIHGCVMTRACSTRSCVVYAKLLWTGERPSFPGMGYPLVPGYESVGRVIQADAQQRHSVGQRVFIPGSSCFVDVRGLFGGAASRLIVPAKRAVAVAENLGEEVILYALAATAYHVTSGLGNEQPDLIIGHGVLGRLLARIAVLAGKKPVVWELDPQRRDGAVGYEVVDPSTCTEAKYKTIVDVSGDAKMLDTLVSHLSPGGEIVLAGFYNTIAFAFAPAFMREARMRIAAQWQPNDLTMVHQLVDAGKLSLAGLITHRATPHDAEHSRSPQRTHE